MQKVLIVAFCLLFISFNIVNAQDTIKEFSDTFLNYSSSDCHFTNNQGETRIGVVHDGYDFSCPPFGYFPMKVSIPMYILEVGEDARYGKYVISESLDGEYRFVFAHLFEIFVEEGEKTNTDKDLFSVGNTGNSSGTHLHLEILKDGLPIQLDKSILDKFPTVYFKKEQHPITAISNAFGITELEAYRDYISFIDTDLYYLNWYKIFVISRYSNISMPKMLNLLRFTKKQNYYHFDIYLGSTTLFSEKYIEKGYTAMRNILLGITREQFISDFYQDRKCQTAEQMFRKMVVVPLY